MTHVPPDVPPPPEPPADVRLDSWKAIASYLERDVATARRWEKREALPVHRHHHDKLGSVYAYAAELDAWREGRRRRAELNPSVEPEPEASPPRWTRRRIAVASALLVIVLGAAGSAARWLAVQEPPPTAEKAITSLAVLPLQPVGDVARDEALELGMTDALITRLSNVDRIKVRPLSAVAQYTGSGRDLGAVGRELGVEAIVEGKIQRAGDRIRITLQLLRVRDGVSLWAGTFDEQFTNIFAVQDSISQQVVRALPVALNSREATALTRRDTNDARAYEHYLKGRYFRSKRTTDGLTKAVEHFEQAIALDPSYAMAHAGLADSFTSWSNFAIIPSTQAYLRARAAALRALALDATLADAHTTLGVVSLFHDWNWPDAEREFTRAIALEPDDATGHRHYGLALMWMGRFDEAQREIQRARELAPVDVEIHHNKALALYWARQYGQAIVEARKTLEMDPHFPQAHRTIAKASVELGLYDQAIAEFNIAIAAGGSQILKAELGHAYAVSGQRDRSLAIQKDLAALAKTKHVSPYDMAILHLGRGETDEAFFRLEQSHAQRERWMLQLEVAPVLDPLRSDPRFADLVQRVGLWP